MKIIKNYTFYTGVITAFLFFFLSQKANCQTIIHEDMNNIGYCPFGICMGDDPASLFANEETANVVLKNKSDYVYGFYLKSNFEWIEAFLSHPEDKIFNSVKISPDTGICGLLVDIILVDEMDETPKINEKQLRFINQIKKYLSKEIGRDTNNIKENNKEINLLWSVKDMDRLKNISEIKLSYSKGNIYEFFPFSRVSFSYKFDNYSMCKDYDP